MKRFFLPFLIFLCLSAVSVQAATVKNMDDKSYTLVVKQENKAFQTIIEAGGTINNLCTFCTIEVVGFSLMDAEDEPFFIIRNGVLSPKN